MQVTVIANKAAAMRWPLATRWRNRDPSVSPKAESLRRADAPIIVCTENSDSHVVVMQSAEERL
jgi:hypothetical protein